MNSSYPITILDNFLESPNDIRNFALRQNYIANIDNNSTSDSVYPGLRSDELDKLYPELYNELVSKIFSVFHNLNYEQIKVDVSSVFQLINSNWEHGWVHRDNCIFAGILYLNGDSTANSGTIFYEPNETFDVKKFQNYQKVKQTFYKQNELTDWYNKDKDDCLSMFSESIVVNNRFNRLVLFGNEYYHSAGNFFGTDEKDSRLTIAFFVNSIDIKNGFYPLVRTGKI
jgi:hypothetical protein